MSEPQTFGVGDLVQVLRATELFGSLSDGALRRVAAKGNIASLGPGDQLFSPGDPADQIHLILAGVLEITRVTADQPAAVPVAYLTAGELVGDMALLTGSERRSGARVPEAATLWTLTHTEFELLATELPEYGMAIARVFARRLEDFIKHMRRQQAKRKELQGHLRYFDMPTVVQTLVTSTQTGVLTIADGGGKPYAEVLILEGQVQRARCGQLEGEEAFYEMFLGPEDGQFQFRSVAAPDPDAYGKTDIVQAAMPLLMQAMRLVDELPQMRMHLPAAPLAARVRPAKLKWDDVNTRAFAKKVVTLLRQARRLEDLIERVPCSTFTLYKIAVELYDTNQIA